MTDPKISHTEPVSFSVWHTDHGDDVQAAGESATGTTPTGSAESAETSGTKLSIDVTAPLETIRRPLENLIRQISAWSGPPDWRQSQAEEALNVLNQLAELPVRLKIHVSAWLNANRRQPSEVRWGICPLGMINGWIERAEVSEERERELEEALLSIAVYYENLYIEGEIAYQAAIIAREALKEDGEN